MQRTYSEVHAEQVEAGEADCDPSCLNAVEKVCTCACGGRKHGRDVEKQKERLEYLNKLLHGEGA